MDVLAYPADISREVTDLKVHAIASLLKGGYPLGEQFAKRHSLFVFEAKQGLEGIQMDGWMTCDFTSFLRWW